MCVPVAEGYRRWPEANSEANSALSRLKQGFDSPWERQGFQYLKRKTPAHRFCFFNFSPTAKFRWHRFAFAKLDRFCDEADYAVLDQKKRRKSECGPPKAKVTRSNRVGCANFFKRLALVRFARGTPVP